MRRNPPWRQTNTPKSKTTNLYGPTTDYTTNYVYYLLGVIQRNGAEQSLGYDVERTELFGDSLYVFLSDKGEDCPIDEPFLEVAAKSFENYIFGKRHWNIVPLVSGLSLWPTLEIGYNKGKVVISSKSEGVKQRDYDLLFLRAFERYLNSQR